MLVAKKTARLVLAGEHTLVRNGLREARIDESSVEVVGEATSGREVVALCARLRPDLVLMDVRMPEMDGIAATRAIKRGLPKIGVLLVTTYASTNYLFEALKAGADGYILKGEVSPDELISLVLRALSGDSLIDPDLAAKLLKRLVNEVQGRTAPLSEEPLEPLTPRQLEVLGLLARGSTNREIAQILVVSRGTVKRHVEDIIAKLEVSDRTQAAVRAYELNLISPTGH